MEYTGNDAWNIHPQTHTNLVEDFFCEGFISLRNQVYGRFPNFLDMLRNSPSREVRFLFNIAKNDPKSRLHRNISFLDDRVGESPLQVSQFKWKQILPKQVVPEKESWRTSWITTLLEVRQNKDYSRLNTDEEQLESMLISLCIT